MEEHEVKTVLVREQATFKKVKVDDEALYMYCDAVEEFYMDEQQMKENDIRMKDASRKEEGLLTASDIRITKKSSQKEWEILKKEPFYGTLIELYRALFSNGQVRIPDIQGN